MLIYFIDVGINSSSFQNANEEERANERIEGCETNRISSCACLVRVVVLLVVAVAQPHNHFQLLTYVIRNRVRLTFMNSYYCI